MYLKGESKISFEIGQGVTLKLVGKNLENQRYILRSGKGQDKLYVIILLYYIIWFLRNFTWQNIRNNFVEMMTHKIEISQIQNCITLLITILHTYVVLYLIEVITFRSYIYIVKIKENFSIRFYCSIKLDSGYYVHIPSVIREFNLQL